MKTCLIKAHKAGLFSLLNNYITCALIYDQVEVDWTDSIYSSDGQNLWNHLFEPLPKLPSMGVNWADLSQDEIDQGYNPGVNYDAVLDNYPDQWLTYKNAAHQYTNPRSVAMMLCNAAWCKLKVKQDILEEAADFIVRNDLGNNVSLMVRAHHHAGEQVSDKSQQLEEYQSALLEQGVRSAFVMAGDLDSIAWLEKRYPCYSFEDTPRMPTRDHDRHQEVQQTPWDARRVLVEVLVASRAKALIHPASNMATAALYMNPELKSIYLP